ncbi:hypothetical protein WH52_13225 [Tenacibaculum holothuriorum]|uniref:O-antigen polymerase n=1 Tax=Tenacibaculum holothuriorum TaxID=1635173 RepID=A0A1Y2PAG8_9FLAO|nr:O-antigen ligase family protein [Tenacibaculum holothuriorum]OSY87021.1 hypothetical protein WH52_13225 [Tenacibaculum holothuriorum]
MKLSLKKIWAILFIISIIIQREIASIEVNTVILTVFTIFFLIINKGKILRQDLELLSFLVIIILIGIISALFNKPTTYDFIRDLIYFTKPLILILLGYFTARSINDWRIIIKTIIYLGFTYAIYHILHTIIFTDFSNTSVANIRKINGLSNVIEVYAIALVILGLKTPFFNVIKGKNSKTIILTTLVLSFILYFSRTMFVSLIFLILGVLNYLKLNKKGLKYLAITAIFFIGLYAYLFSIEIKRNGDTIDGFLYKLKIAPSEIFSPKINLNDHAQLWDHWRAYEAYCAFQSLNQTPVSYFNGKGLGALVDLKFAAPLSSDGNIRYIPILHNGYVFVLYKTGIIGLILYLIFLVYLYYQAYRKTKSIEVKTFGNILSATAFYLIFSSLIITGLYNLKEETAILLGVFLYLKTSSVLKRKYENRNHWN